MSDDTRCEHCGVNRANLFLDETDHYECEMCHKRTRNPGSRRAFLIAEDRAGMLARLKEWDDDCSG